MVEKPTAAVPSLCIPETSSILPLPSGAPDADIAATAWSKLTQPYELEPRHAQEVPAAAGWERACQFVYRVQGREEDIALASLRMANGKAFVNLIVASPAGLDRRMAQLAQLMQAWRPEGLAAEDLSSRRARVWSESDSQAIDAFVREGMEALDIPGVAIAVVQGGRIVECAGFGRCGVDTTELVTGDTRFMIGSSTKALTTLMMARLIGQDRFEWSTPVVELMPDFAFADAQMTRRMEMHHTVSASTGMPRNDLELAFHALGDDPERMLAGLRHLRPTTGFGETFQYSNQLVALGGYAAARAVVPDRGLAESYAQVMDEQVFVPLGMERTTFAHPDSDRALAHGPDMEGAVRAIDMRMEDLACTAPAGAAWSTARDMARYVQMELAGGQDARGGSYIDPQLLRQRHQPQIRIGRDSSYGLGLILEKESGLDVISHGGNTFGFTADMWFMPAHDLGAVVLTNLARANDFTAAVRRKIMELLFAAEDKASAQLSLAVGGRETAVATMRGQVSTDARAQAWIAGLAGSYVSDELGPLAIVRSGEGYTAQATAWSSALGIETLADGRRQLAFTSAPWSGGLRLRVENDGDTLVCVNGQQRCEFHRQSGQTEGK